MPWTWWSRLRSSHDYDCGINQGGRKDDDDLAHLALLSEMMSTILVAIHEDVQA
jgi:hypothetical protein